MPQECPGLRHSREKAEEQLDVHVDIAEQLMYDLDSQAAAHSRLGIRLA